MWVREIDEPRQDSKDARSWKDVKLYARVEKIAKIGEVF